MDKLMSYSRKIKVGEFMDNGDTHVGTVTVELVNKKDGFIVLTMTGEVHKKHSRYPWIMGQCLDHMLQWIDTPMMRRMHEIWKRWHLNDMHAGCVHQRAFEHDGYELHENEVCPICHYRYGSAWIREELSKEVMEEVKSWR